MAKKLYAVEVTALIVVVADDEADARTVAHENIGEITEWQTHVVRTLTGSRHIPHKWHNAIPYGQQENGAEQTVKQLLDAACSEPDAPPAEAYNAAQARGGIPYVVPLIIWICEEPDGKWHRGPQIETIGAPLKTECGATINATGAHTHMHAGHPWAARVGICSKCEALAAKESDGE